jgi:hypothetical protein
MLIEDPATLSKTRREYRLKTWNIIFWLFLAAASLVGAGFFFKQAIDAIGLLFGLLFLVPGLLLTSLVLRGRLVLEANRIEVHSALRTFTANREEIEGIRKVKNQFDSWTRIYLKDNRGAFNVSDSFSGIDDLNQWLRGLPDLDDHNADEIRRALSNPFNGEGHADKLRQAKIWNRALCVAAGLLVLAVIVGDTYRGYALPVLALFPFLGVFLVRRFPLLFTLFKAKRDPRSDSGLVIMLPALGMLLLTDEATHLVDPLKLTFWYFIVAACLVISLFKIIWENASRWGALFGLTVFALMYSMGLINAADIMPDRSTPMSYSAAIVEMHETHGKHTSYYVRLNPWGPFEYYKDVEISAGMYYKVKVGDLVCIGLHPGYLHAPWYSVARCE